ncbi:predicted protein [Bathycoccus prasinos]|uniref:Beta-carotene isomerase D27-like C-terminal domain-containing protein n=1 Tax=Bathycoccus prasinos TaxID=41875 RepID=K8FE55_9CHLO|nr:predicted protein [Bathycoccus prasinos]CCO65951.1 predicted protein [Bathycoccus prasinos]|eukprot:XP_007511863.1 predicted protein [Bathycoccus prasinos]
MVFSVNHATMTTNTAAKNTSNNSGRGKANNRMRRIQSSREATTSSSFPSSSFIHSRGRRRMVSSSFIPRGAATMRIGEGSEREKSKRRRGMDVAATATSNETNASSNNNNGGYAWRGDPIPTKSLPLLPNGKVDYSSIDKSPISKVLTSTIRKLLVQEVGKDTDPRDHANFEALMTSVREVNDMKGTAKDVQTRAKRVFKGILPALYIGWIPPLWKKFVDPNAPKWVTGFSFHLVFIVLFPWLMGPMEGAEHEDVKVPEKLRKTFPFLPEVVSVPQAIKAERCRFLETSSCASVCVNSCKVPSQEWLREDFGMNLHIQPNYDDFSCVWSFNKAPPPLEEDAAILVPCFSNCNSEFKGEKDALKQVMRMKRGVGVTEDGEKDKYTGETLESIARRASEQAIAEANESFADGTAFSQDTFKERVVKVQEGGKCWSVDAERANLR